jgi:hypothetical protein
VAGDALDAAAELFAGLAAPKPVDRLGGPVDAWSFVLQENP